MAHDDVIDEDIDIQYYDRQLRIWGIEGQRKLNNARAVVVGLGHQGVYSALCLAALGVGNIVLVDGEDVNGEMFLDIDVPSGPKSLGYSRLLNLINPGINIEGYPTNLETRIDQLVLKSSDVIIDATNSMRSKRLAYSYGKEKGIPVLSTSSMWGYTKTMLCDFGNKDPAYFMPMFEGHEQDEFMALLMGGVLAEEVRKIIFGEEKNFLIKPFRYRLGGEKRVGFPGKGEVIPRYDSRIYRDLDVALIGAGGLGGWGAILLSKISFGRVDVFDYDRFDATNLHRQILGYDSIGEDGVGCSKALHLAEKIVKMSRGRTKSDGYDVKLTPDFQTERDYDLVLDFVDNWYTRAIVTAYAVVNDIPLVSAGAKPYLGRWNLQVDGKTRCQDCLFKIYEKGRKEEMIRRASCADNPDAAVVTTNAIAAIAAVLDIFTIYEPGKFGEPFNGEQTFRYDNENRIGTRRLNTPCDCYDFEPLDLTVTNEDVMDFHSQREVE